MAAVLGTGCGGGLLALLAAPSQLGSYAVLGISMSLGQVCLIYGTYGSPQLLLCMPYANPCCSPLSKSTEQP